ncbi:MAG: type II secretion system F family protein [Candidatus Eremiobacteraeota bacterium]|nr:type II secretion system F family protein [Candidatus Eremiobacteraeota bacterium]
MKQKGGSLYNSPLSPVAPSTELIICLRQLAALYRAGIPFGRALYIISQQTQHPTLKIVFTELVNNINIGWTITNAISIYPGVFPELYVRLIEVGENTGRLEQMLEKIAFHAEKTREKFMKLFTALAYPVFVIALCLAFLIIGPAFVFRGILEFLQDLKTDLPFPTHVLIFSSAMVRSPLFFVIFPILLFGIFMLARSLWKNRESRRLIQRLILAIPGVGKLYHTSEIATLARTLAIIFESGILLLPGLELTKRVVSIVDLQDAIDMVKKSVTLGDTIYDSFRKSPYFPPVFLQFITAGEQTGELGSMMNWAAWICEQNAEHAINVVLEALQPIIILLIGVIVGFIIIATMAPMLKVAQGLM